MAAVRTYHSPESLAPGFEIGVSRWLLIDQERIDGFGAVTLDPDPMHVDPLWAEEHGPFGGAVAFGFLTMSLLTYLLREAMEAQPHGDARPPGHYLNYGFDRLRLISPVPSGARIRGRFKVADQRLDDRGRWLTTFDCTVETEGSEKPALVAQWLTIWIPPAPV